MYMLKMLFSVKGKKCQLLAFSLKNGKCYCRNMSENSSKLCNFYKNYAIQKVKIIA